LYYSWNDFTTFFTPNLPSSMFSTDVTLSYWRTSMTPGDVGTVNSDGILISVLSFEISFANSSPNWTPYTPESPHSSGTCTPVPGHAHSYIDGSIVPAGNTVVTVQVTAGNTNTSGSDDSMDVTILSSTGESVLVSPSLVFSSIAVSETKSVSVTLPSIYDIVQVKLEMLGDNGVLVNEVVISSSHGQVYTFTNIDNTIGTGDVGTDNTVGWMDVNYYNGSTPGGPQYRYYTNVDLIGN